MKLLLDTHAFLWFDTGSPRLGATAKQFIESPEHERFVSTATLWEMAIKFSLNRLDLRLSFTEYATEAIEENGLRLLPILPAHLDVVSRLPFHHRDPFDRMLAAQALADGLTVLSHGEALDAYGVQRVW